MEKIFEKGIKFESNTYYKAGNSRYDIYLEDCACIENIEHFSLNATKSKSGTVAFFIKDLENVTIDFNDAILVFHGRIIPFILENCKNVKIINFKVDYDRPFYTQAHVLECDTKHMKVRIDDGFKYKVEDGYLYAVSDTWEKKLNQNDCLLWLFDRSGKKEYPIILSLFGPEIFPNDNPPFPIGQILVEEEGDALIFKGDFPMEWEVNDGNNSLLFTHEIRDKCTITLLNCENIYIENFILIHGAAFAIVAMNSRDLYIDNFSMYMDYNGNGRLVTNNADAIHLFNCKGEFVLKNSYMDGLLDDTVNIHNNYLTVAGIEGNRITCKFVGKALNLQLPLFVKDDIVAIFAGRTLEKKCEYKVLDVLLDFENEQYIYTLDREIENVEIADTVENLSGHPTVLIENCEFGRFRGTMRLQSGEKTVVKNCKFHNKGESIIFTGDTTYWFESGPVNDFLIEDCSFKGTEYGPRIKVFGEVEFTEKEKYYHKNITIRNCSFEKGLVAYLNNTDNFVFKDNSSNGEMEIITVNCGKIDCEKTVKIKEE